jgi:hypothetical protein
MNTAETISRMRKCSERNFIRKACGTAETINMFVNGYTKYLYIEKLDDYIEE